MRAQASQLRRDRRGMLMVVAVPMAAVLAVCLWYLAGIGDALLYRERLQDAADATAFESAVLHARGMNGVAMLNILLSLLLATLAALRASEVLALAGVIAATGGDAPATDQALAGRIVETMAMVSRIQEGVSAAMPVLATVSSTSDSTSFYRGEGAADEVVALSHALLPTRIDARIGAHPLQRWSFGARGGVGPAARLGAHALEHEANALPSLPVQRDDAERLCQEASETALTAAGAQGDRRSVARRHELRDRAATLLCRSVPAPARVLDAAENGNVLLQVWAAAERALPGSRTRFLAASDAAPASGMATAQAEYFYACGTGREAWSACRHDAAWSLGWSARMRRVWSPTDALAGAPRRLLDGALDDSDAIAREGLARLGVRGAPRSALSARRLFEALASDPHATWTH